MHEADGSTLNSSHEGKPAKQEAVSATKVLGLKTVYDDQREGERDCKLNGQMSPYAEKHQAALQTETERERRKL